MKVIIDCVRHGETDWNKNKKVQGSKDIPLNTTGIQQATTLSRNLPEDYEHYVSSSMVRAYQTACILAGDKAETVIKTSYLVERNYGRLEGFSWDDIQTKYPYLPYATHGAGHRYVTHAPNLGVESWDDFVTRIRGEILSWSEYYTAGSPKVLFIMHGGCIRALLEGCDNPPDSVPNCSIVRFSITDEGVRFLKVLETITPLSGGE